MLARSGRLANQLKINEIGEVGKLVKEDHDGCSENWKIGEEDPDQ